MLKFMNIMTSILAPETLLLSCIIIMVQNRVGLPHSRTKSDYNDHP